MWLRIVGRRADGYHLIDSLLVPLDLADEVTVEVVPCRRTAIRVLSDDPGVPAGAANLAYRAAACLLGVAGRHARVTIAIRKHVPVAAGLGGGSSDAAAVIRALNLLLDARLSRAALARVGARIGADVPFFLQGGPARVSGVGEEVRPWRGWEPRWVVLVVPPFGVRTAWAYRKVRRSLTNHRPGHRMRGFRELPVPAAINDLEAGVFRRYPVLRDLKGALRRAGAHRALMAGSGSAVFGVFRTRRDAERAALRLGRRGGLRVFVCRPRKRRPRVTRVRPEMPGPAAGR